MNFIRVNWKHDLPSEPTTIYSEVDDSGWELRKVEVFANGAMGYASKLKSAGGTGLSKEPLPSLNEIAIDPQFDPVVISPDDFERIWKTAAS
ncbi:hypothetical protein CAL29_30530 [Bordetella genomosp. 10]|uniref:DUF6881 domain-containing protein n=1 Tax=Bordetella genomosp. 10 TaxID=1416804 RepID=A0A261S4S9_9BORD|nr:hypothetical protein [Bordetella genomosp. 10]OZI32165.1 hypothetical protein CAL29_30530 [Bordetella genomosp. 10]